ncbi:ComEA family DNA-binding protein [Streptomyces sp. H27-D2]|uniref:ComEA family DNA-binding protein n=1 Tax=Streptomyces sp. H27-D2 TaxID=3046304 RepID=UPI002DBB876D|nr:ComEA family DNA-binding protein [Streptomyces sp. H27-D2]MEC4014811.1 ComEA family DNA-binding protein [Streptomyces sp. H27-D2]
MWGRSGRWGPALRERLPLWVQSRCGLEPKTLAALAVVLVAAAVFAAQHFWTGRPETVRAPAPQHAAGPSAAGVGPSPGLPGLGQPSGIGAAGATDATGVTGAAGKRLVVDVAGKVREPGIHRMPPGSRVADAISASGGVLRGTDTRGLNKARLLTDGEQIVVGAGLGATGPPGAPAPGSSAGSGAGGGSAGAAGVAGAPPGAPVSLNSATVEQLDGLPGIGPVLAQHIIDFRTQHGGFRSIDQLRDVNGIGDRRFADLRPLVQP